MIIRIATGDFQKALEKLKAGGAEIEQAPYGIVKIIQHGITIHIRHDEYEGEGEFEVTKAPWFMNPKSILKGLLNYLDEFGGYKP